MKKEIRDPAVLAKDIERYTLEREIRREIVYTAADIPALERENAEDQRRLEGLDADSPEAVSLRDEICVRARKIDFLKTHDKTATTEETRTERVPRERGIDALKAHIMANWTIREIEFFSDFTHGGTYDAGMGWRINYAGYVADTAEGQSNLIDLFKDLVRLSRFFVGIKTYLQAQPTDIPPVLLCHCATDEGSPFDMTLDELMRSIPVKDETLKRILEIAERNSAGVSYLVNDREKKMAANAKRGRENQAKGDGETRACAEKDMKAALQRVRDRVNEKEKKGQKVVVLDVCRAVCREFTPKSARKNEFGKCADGYYHLTGAGGKEIKAETLARNYRKEYGPKKDKKAADAQ